MRWGRTLTLLSFVFGLGWALLGPAPPVQACSCAHNSNRELIDMADIAFVGTVVKVDDPLAAPLPDGTRILDGGRKVTITYRVDQVLKGRLGPTVDVESVASGAACGVAGDPGRQLALAVFESGQKLTTNLCAQLDLAKVPLHAGSGGSDGGNDSGMLVAGIGLGLAVVGAAYAGSRRSA